ncbi:hypothetical protein LZ31DRAFT_485781, partial [Colletotrichum somersetense]
IVIPGRREYFCRLLWIMGLFMVRRGSREDMAGNLRSHEMEDSKVLALLKGIAAWARLTTETIRAADHSAQFRTVVLPCSRLREFGNAGESGRSSDHSARGPQGKIKVDIRAHAKHADAARTTGRWERYVR